MSDIPATLEDLARVEQRLDRRIDAINERPELEGFRDDLWELKRAVSSILHRLEGISAAARDEHAAMAAGNHAHETERLGIEQNPAVRDPMRQSEVDPETEAFFRRPRKGTLP